MQELFDGLQPHRILVGMALDMPHLIDNVHFNEEVLEALAGLSPREIERLTEAGITGRTPPRT